MDDINDLVKEMKGKLSRFRVDIDALLLSIEDVEKKNGNADKPASKKQIEFLKRLLGEEFEMSEGLTSRQASELIDESLEKKD